MEQDTANQAEKTRELEARVKELTATVEDLKSTLAWFRRNMFGRKSEQMPNNDLLNLLPNFEALAGYRQQFEIELP